MSAPETGKIFKYKGETFTPVYSIETNSVVKRLLDGKTPHQLQTEARLSDPVSTWISRKEFRLSLRRCGAEVWCGPQTWEFRPTGGAVLTAELPGDKYVTKLKTGWTYAELYRAVARCHGWLKEKAQ